MLYVLSGWNQAEGDLEQFFTEKERDAAVTTAKGWDRKGWNPVLMSKTYRGDFKFIQIHQRRIAA